MNNKDLLALYGLKYNPFAQNLPAEAIWVEPATESFGHRLEAMIPQGGFALITGDPGQGKSKILQWVSHRLGAMPDIAWGVMERPQSRLGDFYRELGELFGVSLSPANRYGSFKTLREKWKAHCRSSLLRPVLLIDEAQEVSPACLTELRLLQSASFDSENLLFTILCGDGRLTDMFRMPELIPLGSRIRTRLPLPSRTPEQLRDYLDFALEQAGNSSLMTAELMQLLASHSLNNLRVINNMAAELLASASEKNLPRIDEALYFELFNPISAKPRRNRL